MAETLAMGTPMMLPSSLPVALGPPSAGGPATSSPSTTTATAPAPAGSSTTFPPPKTDKPRPHVCATCSRSFARLEHLKRHERSHTKEKPFECPECTRCFARRDLLLRHQQKLHMTATVSSRPRTGRRDSTTATTGAGAGRVRKNSVANAAAAGGPGPHTAASMRPRANTISHVDGNALGLITATGAPVAPITASMGSRHTHHASLSRLPGQNGFNLRGISPVVGHHALPRLETNGLPGTDMAGGMRTAPPLGAFPFNPDVDGFYAGEPGSTINPAQLHFNDSPQSYALGTPSSPYHSGYPGVPISQPLLEPEENFHWVNGFDTQLPFGDGQEYAVAESSPSALSAGSHSGMSDVMLDGSNLLAQGNPAHWSQRSIVPPSQLIPSTFATDPSISSVAEILPPPGTISPKSLHGQFGPTDLYYTSPPPAVALSPHTVVGAAAALNRHFHPPMVFNPGARTPSSAPMNGNHGSISASSTSVDSINDLTRQALLSHLSPLPSVGRTYAGYSASSNGSPLMSGPTRADPVEGYLPSTADLRRYVTAFTRYFSPHLPFLHLPTLSFDSVGLADHNQTDAASGGAGCLLLAMTAIGALFEFESGPSKQLFEAAQKLIQKYLDDGSGANGAAPLNQEPSDPLYGRHETPLSLVQAMLLTVVYGHNCADRIALQNPSIHRARLASLARAAGLTLPLSSDTAASYQMSHHIQPFSNLAGGEDIQMGDVGISYDVWPAEMRSEVPSEQLEWYAWKVTEERKRTLYAIFVLSSLLVSPDNHAAAITNSEIKLDLPCDEDLWTAETAQEWYGQGGATKAEQKALSFSVALGTLLSASHRQNQQHNASRAFSHFGSGFHMDESLQSDIKPSTFGCLVLINALHNYIWETKQRHHARQWTTQETEAMQAHIEPALKAWHAAWASDPHHSHERPNPFGKGPLSADSIPLLDLAYVRLFDNRGRSEETLFQSEVDAMAEESARGYDIIQHPEHSPSSISTTSDLPDSLKSGSSLGDSPTTATSSPDLEAIKTPTSQHQLLSMAPTSLQPPGSSSTRERHLRKAAYYAAQSLSMSDKVGVTFAGYDSRELPLQSALCAFDCAQVLAEWVSTVQERVGQSLGIHSPNTLDLGHARQNMLLDDEDCKLFDSIAEMLKGAEVKMATEVHNLGLMSAMVVPSDLSANDRGYGSKILSVTAYMLDRAAVWPIIHLMARSLNTQAARLEPRAAEPILFSA